VIILDSDFSYLGLLIVHFLSKINFFKCVPGKINLDCDIYFAFDIYAPVQFLDFH
jgi:hypothetical protein